MIVAEEVWLSRQDAAKRAGVHYNTLREWQEQGLVITKRSSDAANAEVLTELSSLDKFIATRHTPSRLSESETRERLAALEAENRELRARLAHSETERRELQEQQQRLLERVLRLAERE